MIFFVDGDNKYKERIEGVGKLTSKDTVYIYYNDKSGALMQKEARGAIENKTKAKIKFKQVHCAPQAVDFKIACDISTMIENIDNQVICTISEDKHFETIIEAVKSNNSSNIIKNFCCVKDSLDYKLFEIDDIMEFEEYVTNNFSKDLVHTLNRNLIKMAIQINERCGR